MRLYFFFLFLQFYFVLAGILSHTLYPHKRQWDIFIRLGEKCYLTFFYWQISMKTVTNTAFIVTWQEKKRQFFTHNVKWQQLPDKAYTWYLSVHFQDSCYLIEIKKKLYPVICNIVLSLSKFKKNYYLAISGRTSKIRVSEFIPIFRKIPDGRNILGKYKKLNILKDHFLTHVLICLLTNINVKRNIND